MYCVLIFFDLFNHDLLSYMLNGLEFWVCCCLVLMGCVFGLVTEIQLYMLYIFVCIVMRSIFFFL